MRGSGARAARIISGCALAVGLGSWTAREGGARTRLLAELARGREEGVIVALLAPAAKIAQLARPRAVRQALQQEVDSSPGKVDVRHDARTGDGDAGDDVARGPPGAVPAGYGHQSARPLKQRQQQLGAIERVQHLPTDCFSRSPGTDRDMMKVQIRHLAAWNLRVAKQVRRGLPLPALRSGQEGGPWAAPREVKQFLIAVPVAWSLVPVHAV